MEVAPPKKEPRGDPTLPRLRLAVVIAAGVAYATSAVPAVLGGDAGEMATLFATGGIAHPPGFPTMVLWLRALHWIPCRSPAHGAALATAVAATAAVWALQRAALAWGASGGAAVIASAAFAFSKEAWTLGSEAEVFALSAFFAGVILTLAGPEQHRLSGGRLTFALGLVAALALGDHQTIVLLAPVGLLAAYRACRDAPSPLSAAALGLLGLAVGVVAPYSYAYALARTADPRVVPMWIEAPTLEGLWFHVRRGAYGTLSLAPAGVAVAYQPLEACGRFARSALADLFGLPAFALVAVASSLQVRRSVRYPGMLFALFLSFALCGPGFQALDNLPTEGLGARVAARFDLLPELVLSVLSAIALDAVIPVLRKRAAIVYPFLALVGLGAALASWPEVARAHRPDVAHFVENALEAAPETSIIVGNGDAEWGGFLYARYAERKRLDVAFVNPRMVTQAWYRRELTSLTGVSFETPEGKPIGPKTMLSRLLATGRPLFYTDWPSRSLAATPHDSYGPLMRVLPADAPPTDLDALFAANTRLFERFVLDLPPPDEPSDWGHSLYTEYGRAWGELAERLGKAGRKEQREACLARVAAIAPWSLTPVPGP
jgi:hypothetical protein